MTGDGRGHDNLGSRPTIIRVGDTLLGLISKIIEGNAIDMVLTLFHTRCGICNETHRQSIRENSSSVDSASIQFTHIRGRVS